MVKKYRYMNMIKTDKLDAALKFLADYHQVSMTTVVTNLVMAEYRNVKKQLKEEGKAAK